MADYSMIRSRSCPGGAVAQGKADKPLERRPNGATSVLSQQGYRYGLRIQDPNTGEVYAHDDKMEVAWTLTALPDTVPDERRNELLEGVTLAASYDEWTFRSIKEKYVKPQREPVAEARKRGVEKGIKARRRVQKNAKGQVLPDPASLNKAMSYLAKHEISIEDKFSLPHELPEVAHIAICRAILEGHIARGEFAMCGLHLKPLNKHAHVLVLTHGWDERTRDAKGANFGPLLPWNVNYGPKRDDLELHHRIYESAVNGQFAEAGYDLRIDRRSFGNQGLPFLATKHVGPGGHGKRITKREAFNDAVRSHNEALLRRQPEAIIDELGVHRASFTAAMVGDALQRRMPNLAPEELGELLRIAMDSDRIVPLGQDARRDYRYSAKKWIDQKQEVVADCLVLADRFGHTAGAADIQARSWWQDGLSEIEQHAVAHIVQGLDLSVLATDWDVRGRILRPVSRMWGEAGFDVKPVAITAREAAQLGADLDRLPVTLGELEMALDRLARPGKGGSKGRPKGERERMESLQVGTNSIVVVEEAGLDIEAIGRLTRLSRDRGAKLMLVGSPDRLHADLALESGQRIEIGQAGAAFRAVARVPADGVLIDMHQDRQLRDWQLDVARDLDRLDVRAALHRFNAEGHILWGDNAERARATLVDLMAHDAGDGQVAVATRREVIGSLNEELRRRRRAAGLIHGEDRGYRVDGQDVVLAVGDIVRCSATIPIHRLREGQRGKVAQLLSDGVHLQIDDGREVQVTGRDLGRLEHGYAVAPHQLRRMSVERAYILADDTLLDAQATRTVLTRHTDDAVIVASKAAHGGPAGLTRHLSRDGSWQLPPEQTRFSERDLAAKERVERYVAINAEATRLFAGMCRSDCCLDGHSQWPHWRKLREERASLAREMLQSREDHRTHLVAAGLGWTSVDMAAGVRRVREAEDGARVVIEPIKVREARERVEAMAKHAEGYRALFEQIRRELHGRPSVDHPQWSEAERHRGERDRLAAEVARDPAAHREHVDRHRIAWRTVEAWRASPEAAKEQEPQLRAYDGLRADVSWELAHDGRDRRGPTPAAAWSLRQRKQQVAEQALAAGVKRSDIELDARRAVSFALVRSFLDAKKRGDVEQADRLALDIGRDRKRCREFAKDLGAAWNHISTGISAAKQRQQRRDQEQHLANGADDRLIFAAEISQRQELMKRLQKRKPDLAKDINNDVAVSKAMAQLREQTKTTAPQSPRMTKDTGIEI